MAAPRRDSRIDHAPPIEYSSVRIAKMSSIKMRVSSSEMGTSFFTLRDGVFAATLPVAEVENASSTLREGAGVVGVIVSCRGRGGVVGLEIDNG